MKQWWVEVLEIQKFAKRMVANLQLLIDISPATEDTFKSDVRMAINGSICEKMNTEGFFYLYLFYFFIYFTYNKID